MPAKETQLGLGVHWDCGREKLILLVGLVLENCTCEALLIIMLTKLKIISRGKRKIKAIE